MVAQLDRGSGAGQPYIVKKADRRSRDATTVESRVDLTDRSCKRRSYPSKISRTRRISASTANGLVRTCIPRSR